VDERPADRQLDVRCLSPAAYRRWWGRRSAGRHTTAWSGLHLVGAADLLAIERCLADRMIDPFGLDVSAVALDMTNYPPCIDTGDKAPLAQRGKAKQYWP
jgi:hypothetical protein